ncbi:hypothetical protein ACI6PO_15775 [Agrobacterium tumefaciens]
MNANNPVPSNCKTAAPVMHIPQEYLGFELRKYLTKTSSSEVVAFDGLRPPQIRTTSTEVEVKGGSGVMFGRLRPQRRAAERQ